MSYYFGINSNDVSSLFSSLSTASSKTKTTDFFTLSSNLGDYNSISNGSYKKLLSAYYKKQQSSTDTTKTETKDSDTESELVLSKNSAYNLASSAKDLMNQDFDQSSRDDILKKVNTFINDYNTMLDNSSGLDTEAITRQVDWAVGQTESSSDLLKEIGITVNSDDSLSLDQTAFKNADINAIKTLFSGSDSFAGDIAEKSNSIYNLSSSYAYKASGDAAYTSNGSYKTVTTQTLYDNLF